MKTFKVVNGDLVFDSTKNLVMIDGIEEQKQSIERILTTNINEWFLNVDHGLDYNAIQGKGKDEEGIKLAITEAVYQDTRIIDIDFRRIEIDRTSRRLIVELDATTNTGEVISSQEVLDA